MAGPGHLLQRRPGAFEALAPDDHIDDPGPRWRILLRA
jgi:hypothetical protein